MLVSVIIPTRNCGGSIAAALEATVGQRLDGDFEVIVVDNGSDDGTAELAAGFASPVRVIRQTNRGPAEARNRGVAEAAGDLLAFTDGDCIPQPGWLAAGVAACNTADLVQGRVRPVRGAPLGPFDRSIWVESETGLYETANLFVRRPMFEEVGGFAAWFKATDDRPFGEDTWLGWRLRRAGARTAFCAEALVEHAVLPGNARSMIAEQARAGQFAGLVELVPELRGKLLFARFFLTRRSAAFDLALTAALATRLTASRLPLAAALPYALIALGRAGRWRRRGPAVLVAEVAADTVGCVSLITHSLRRRTPVL